MFALSAIALAPAACADSPDDTSFGTFPGATGGTTSATADAEATEGGTNGNATDDGSESSTGTQPTDEEGDAGTDGAVDSTAGELPDTPGADGASFGSGAHFTDVADMFDYINEQRTSYLSHDRWRGAPFFGTQHTTITWPTEFTWDEQLAAGAQSLADAHADGQARAGEPASDGLTPAIYLEGVDTDHYVVSGLERSESWGVNNQSSLSHHHGAARMAIFYHDSGGFGAVVTKIGIGASDAGDGDTAWVMIFE